MKKTPPTLATVFASGLALILTACGASSAKDFGGRWRTVNRYDEKTVEIPLDVPYIYYIAPMDGTLRTALSRWTTDNGMKLRYDLRSDFTLTKAASGIRTSELRDATSQINAIYAAQGLTITIDGPDLIVESTSAPTPPADAN